MCIFVVGHVTIYMLFFYFATVVCIHQGVYLMERDDAWYSDENGKIIPPPPECTKEYIGQSVQSLV